ncbi:MAG: glycosyltransferase [Phycisphaerae bacterium]
MMVGCVSDISIGYGTPQIPLFMRSVHAYLGETGRPLIIEVDQPERPPRHDHFPDLEIIRVYTRHHPHAVRAGKIDYILGAARILNERRPEVLMIPNAYCLPVLWKLNYHPRLVVYYVFEMANPFGYDYEETRLNAEARNLVDLVIYPEQNRAIQHMQQFEYQNLTNLVLFNAVPQTDEPQVPAQSRNKRIIYHGTIHEERTQGAFYLDEAVRAMPIDLFGNVESVTPDFRDQLIAEGGNLKYHGYVDNATLKTLRKSYSYSITYWNPSIKNQFFACPNKFFESIAAGVPPITAPHPQTRELVECYDCGIVMKDWSLSSFVSTLEHAMSLLGSPRYARMVRNCREACRRELNWEYQFQKVKVQLDKFNLIRQGTRDAQAVA